MAYATYQLTREGGCSLVLLLLKKDDFFNHVQVATKQGSSKKWILTDLIGNMFDHFEMQFFSVLVYDCLIVTCTLRGHFYKSILDVLRML